jgi:hypothetical protein
MPEPRSKTKVSRPRASALEREYSSEIAALQSMRLIAAPDSGDDLSDEELASRLRGPAQSPELIQHLIDFIKAL